MCPTGSTFIEPLDNPGPERLVTHSGTGEVLEVSLAIKWRIIPCRQPGQRRQGTASVPSCSESWKTPSATNSEQSLPEAADETGVDEVKISGQLDQGKSMVAARLDHSDAD